MAELVITKEISDCIRYYKCPECGLWHLTSKKAY